MTFEVLHVPYTSVTARGVAYLGAHGKLRSLDMYGTMIQDDDLEHLRELDISGTCVDQDAVSIIAKMPAIRVLHIHAVSIDQDSIDELKRRRPDIRIFHEARKIQPCRPVPHLEDDGDGNTTTIPMPASLADVLTASVRVIVGPKS